MTDTVDVVVEMKVPKSEGQEPKVRTLRSSFRRFKLVIELLPLQSVLETLVQANSSYLVLRDRYQKLMNGGADGVPVKQIEGLNASLELEETFLDRTQKLYAKLYSILSGRIVAGDSLDQYDLQALGEAGVKLLADHHLNKEQEKN